MAVPEGAHLHAAGQWAWLEHTAGPSRLKHLRQGTWPTRGLGAGTLRHRQRPQSFYRLVWNSRKSQTLHRSWAVGGTGQPRFQGGDRTATSEAGAGNVRQVPSLTVAAWPPARPPSGSPHRQCDFPQGCLQARHLTTRMC